MTLQKFLIQHTLAFRGGYVLENPREQQHRDAQVKAYGKNGVRGTKDTRNMILNMYNQ
jgi:hypothetical protein